MIESMACGTPVAAVRRGAVPEVIDDGVSGVVVDDVGGLAEAVMRADAIAPEACREHVEEHFSDRQMVRRYLDAYRLLLAP
jgi:glycosyltransferase involved in cell wall biosynthesis